MPNLLKAFWLPIRHSWQVLIIFWPVILVFMITVILGAVSAVPNILPRSLTSLISTCLFLYMVLVLSSALINWHRFLIRKDQPVRAAFTPSPRDIHYIAISMLLGMVIAFILVFAGVLVAGLIEEQLALAIVLAIITILLTYLLLSFLKSTFMSLPAIALSDKKTLQESLNFNTATTMSLPLSILIVVAVFLTATAIPFLILSVIALSPEDYPDALEALGIMALLLTLTILLAFYGVLTITALLSLFYQEMVTETQKHI